MLIIADFFKACKRKVPAFFVGFSQIRAERHGGSAEVWAGNMENHEKTQHLSICPH